MDNRIENERERAETAQPETAEAVEPSEAATAAAPSEVEPRADAVSEGDVETPTEVAVEAGEVDEPSEIEAKASEAESGESEIEPLEAEALETEQSAELAPSDDEDDEAQRLIDEFEFENVYDITEKVYLDWSTHPVGRLAKKRSRLMLAMSIVEMALSIALLVVGIFTINSLYIVVGGGFTLYFVLNLTVLQKRKYKKEFREMLKRRNTDALHRVMRFGDKISISDGGAVTNFDYSLLTDQTEDENWFYLWLGDSSAYRVKKGAFTAGEQSAFAAFVAGKRRKKKAK